MKIRNLLLLSLLTVGGTIAMAQEQRQIKEEGKTIFNPHWFMQLQVGAAHTLGEAKFADLISPAAAVNVGYKFAPAFGARIGVSGWQAKGGWVTPAQVYQYKYLQGNLDLMADLSALFCGFNPNRVFNGYIFAGVGLNHAFDNDEANALDTRTYEMEYLWQDSKNFVAGRMGLGCDLRLNDRLAINVEGNANILSDKFNSKKAGNCDWQFNVLVGLSIKLGKGYTKTAPVYYEPEPVVAPEPKPEPVVEKKPEPKPEPVVVVEPMKQSIFFALNSALLQDDQQSKIDSMVSYMKKYPNSKVAITGYADKETGNPTINMTLSEKRANNVAEALKTKGIAADRIVTDHKGDTVQPYTVPEENRVSICIVGE
jgi:outer membrane protein